VTLAVDLAVPVPFAHSSVAGVTALTGVLAPRKRWTSRDLTKLTKRFARHAAAELHHAARFDPAERWYLRLAGTEQVELYLMTWTPGQHSSTHAHTGDAGAYTVLYGELAETGPDGRVRLRAAGEGVALPDRHSLANLNSLYAISIHAYSPPRYVSDGPC
jgi:predicted metal-dependent enzyme (double-stranded beta helix superfamily)